MENQKKHPKIPTFSDVILFVSIVATIVFLGRLLWLADHGFDFTDEGYYLAWISNPSLYSISVSQFGFVYHPLYKLVDGDVATLRQINVLLIFSLAWMLCHAFLRPHARVRSIPDAHRVALGAVLASTSLVFFDPWIPTPSYNSLALQSVLLTVTGLILAEGDFCRRSLFGWVLVAVGLFFAAMAKPTTAAALGIFSAVYLLLAGKARVKLAGLVLAVSAAILLSSAVVIDGSLTAFVNRLQAGAEATQILGGGHSYGGLFRLDSIDLGEAGQRALVVLTLSVCLFAALLGSQRLAFMIIGGLLISVLIILGVLAIYGQVVINVDVGPFRRLLMLAVPSAAILISIIHFGPRAIARMPGSELALALFLVCVPHIYAFGTNNNYWQTGSGAAFFWVLAGLVMVRNVASARLLPHLIALTTGAQVIALMIITASVESPYRQPQALRLSENKVEMADGKSTLLLSDGYATYLDTLMALAGRAGFWPGTPVIDLTGQSPGSLYALGASIIGQAWTIGGYPGSEKLAGFMLSNVSCDQLAKAWLLYEPKGPRRIDPAVLNTFGANLERDFRSVGPVDTPPGAGGYSEPRSQYLLKPVRTFDDARASCALGRTNHRVRDQ